MGHKAGDSRSDQHVRADREELMSPLILGSTIRERRRELGLRQAELAELAGVSTRFVGELEHGKQTAQLDKFQAVVNALGLVMELRLRNGQES